MRSRIRNTANTALIFLSDTRSWGSIPWDTILRCTFITFFRYVDELDHVAMVESGSSDSNNTITQGECLCAVGTGQVHVQSQKSGPQKLSSFGDVNRYVVHPKSK
jgi:hypothetical protein